MNDQRDPETEAKIRRALDARAEETTVSPDALESIRDRRTTARWARPAAYGAVAAIVVLIAGIALLNRSDNDDGIVDSANTTSVAPSPSSTLPSDPYPTTGPSTPSTPVAEDDIAAANQHGLSEPLETNPAAVVAAGLELWRSDDVADPAQLASDYVRTQLGVDDPVLSPTSVALRDVTPGPDIQPFGVHRRTEGGEISDAFAFKVVVFTDDRGPAVTHVVSDAFRIDMVEHNTADTLRVTGSGTAFEGTALLRINGVETLVTVGGVDPGEFSAIVARPDDGDAVTVELEGATAFDGEVPEIIAYVVIPIPRQTTLSVFGVADDDVLNVRRGAGVGNDIVATLDPDAGGVVPTGGEEFIDDEVWWEIETEAGPGWANSRFLVTTRRAGEEPADIEDSVKQSLRTLDPADLADRVEIGGIGVYADFPTPWTSVVRDDFDRDRNWSPEGTDDRGCDCDMTVAEFLGFDTAKWELAEFSPGTDVSLDGPNFFFEVGQHPEFFDRFTTLTIYIPEPDPQTSLDWRRYTAVIDYVDGTPMWRGLWRWGWTP